MTFICPRCKKPAEKKRHRKICAECVAAKEREYYRTLTREQHVNPELSVHALRIKLTATKMEIRRREKEVSDDSTRKRRALINLQAAIETRISELTNQHLWEAA